MAFHDIFVWLIDNIKILKHMINTSFPGNYERPSIEVCSICTKQVLMASFEVAESNEAFGKDGSLKDFEW